MSAMMDSAKLLQSLIDISGRARCGNAQQLLPDPTTASHTLTKYANGIRQNITPELGSQLQHDSYFGYVVRLSPQKSVIFLPCWIKSGTSGTSE